jgi:hypothetical protein
MTVRLSLPLEFLLGVEQVREVDLRLLIREELGGRAAERVDRRVGGRDTRSRVDAEGSGEGLDPVSLDGELDRRILPPRDGRYLSQLRRP